MPTSAAILDFPSAPLALDPPLAPAWVGAVICRDGGSVSLIEEGDLVIEVTRGSEVAFCTATFTEAAELSDAALHGAVARTYSRLA